MAAAAASAHLTSILSSAAPSNSAEYVAQEMDSEQLPVDEAVKHWKQHRMVHLVHCLLDTTILNLVVHAREARSPQEQAAHMWMKDQLWHMLCCWCVSPDAT
jgi:hypothetical protein